MDGKYSLVFVCVHARALFFFFFCVSVHAHAHTSACEKTKTSWMNYMICNDKWSQTFTEAPGLTYIYRLEK